MVAIAGGIILAYLVIQFWPIVIGGILILLAIGGIANVTESFSRHSGKILINLATTATYKRLCMQWNRFLTHYTHLTKTCTKIANSRLCINIGKYIGWAVVAFLSLIGACILLAITLVIFSTMCSDGGNVMVASVSAIAPYIILYVLFRWRKKKRWKQADIA